jgi:predicted DNA-binding transcriptional regulator AlpA
MTAETESFHQRLNKIREFLASTAGISTEDEARAAVLSARQLCETDDDHEDAVISVAAAARFLNVHHQTLRRWWRRGTFPRPKKLGPGRIGFLRSEVLNWIATRPLVPGQQETNDR